MVKSASGFTVEIRPGVRFGMLVVITRVVGSGGKARSPAWLCRCDCGREVERLSWVLRAERGISCGCKRRAAAAKQEAE